MTPKLMTIGSLFSGIGGLELGLERGLNEACIQTEVRWQCEIEDFPRRVLAKHWPHTRRYRDVRTMGREERVEPVDLICGGFPCQDLSYAGKRAGLNGERSGLFWELMRIVCLVRPRYVVLENVSGLLTADQGEAMGSVLGTLAAFGYDAEWACIPASSIGAPHIRDRIFILCYPHEKGEPNVAFDAQMARLSALAGSDRGAWGPYSTSGVRMANGLSHRMDRLAALGNAVVPQVAAILGRRIAELESA